MSSKADFYIKRGNELEWQGSIMWGGNERSIPTSITQSCSELEFTMALTYFLDGKKDAVRPPTRWPWHWHSSKMTDYAYIMIPEKGAVYISNFNSPTYTIYQFRDFQKRNKSAKINGKSIISFEEYLEKISTYTPKFPKMILEPDVKLIKPN
jgi:hypothetical protein